MKTIGRAVVIGVVAMSAVACNGSSPASPSATGPAATFEVGASASAAGGAGTLAKPGYADAAKPGDKTIVDIVLLPDGEFDVLQAAVVRAGVVDALNGTRQLTVFAPTDAAFVTTLGVANEAAAIAAVNGLPLDTLQNILLYHVASGRRNSNSVLAAPAYHMLNGGTLSRDHLGGGPGNGRRLGVQRHHPRNQPRPDALTRQWGRLIAGTRAFPFSCTRQRLLPRILDS